MSASLYRNAAVINTSSSTSTQNVSGVRTPLHVSQTYADKLFPNFSSPEPHLRGKSRCCVGADNQFQCELSG